MYFQFVVSYLEFGGSRLTRIVTRRLATTGSVLSFVRSMDTATVAVLLAKRSVLLAAKAKRPAGAARSETEAPAGRGAFVQDDLCVLFHVFAVTLCQRPASEGARRVLWQQGRQERALEPAPRAGRVAANVMTSCMPSTVPLRMA